MSSASYLVAKVTDASVSISVTPSGKLLLEPASGVSDELRELVRRHKQEIILELRERWGGKAPARDYSKFPPRRDEYPLFPAPKYPQSYIRRRRR